MTVDEREIRRAILKVALGYSLEEVMEEYGVEDGELKLVKRRETKKDVPPDLKAVRLLLEEKELSSLSDEELEAEKARLLKTLQEASDAETGREDPGRKTGSGAQEGAR